ncbi:Mov34/MPN/PAD-1 family protein [Paenibacillus sp. BR2-3]|uniref:Mov34/MPN/PAD-1 family protein n=1 Tax=Paenibacillus sp. BR2-3 TaxID=3048494 RepID=UPI003977D738
MKYAFGKMEVIINEEVLRIFESYRQVRKDQHESGGILLGRVYMDRIVIEHVSEPSETDRSGRCFFERDVKTAQQIVDKNWEESGGQIIYLGEWHTHPEAVPHPSLTDRKLISSMIRDSRMEIDFLFIVIIGWIDFYFAAQIKSGRLLQLKQLGQ